MLTIDQVRAQGNKTSQLSFLTEQVRDAKVDEATATSWAKELKWPDALVQSMRQAVYAGDFGEGRRAKLGGGLPMSSPVFGTGEFQPSKAAERVRRELDTYLNALGEAVRQSPEAGRAALKALKDKMASIGADAIDEIGFGSDPANRGLGYINSRIRLAGLDIVLEPIMDARQRAFIRDSKRGDVRGTTAELSIKWDGFSPDVVQCLAKAGIHQEGKWSVKVSGNEAFRQRVNARDGSVSSQIREFHESVDDPDLLGAINGLIGSSLDPERFPNGFTLNVDLRDIEPAAREKARAILAELEPKGFKLRYYETDTHKIMDGMRISLSIDRQVQDFLEEVGPMETWSPAQYQRYTELFKAYHGKPNTIFEDGQPY